MHYVYRITNHLLKKHYYGVRRLKISNPLDDLGVKYFSSSTDKDFIQDQKQNPQDYKYKLIKLYTSREDAITHEIKLHHKFNVGVNESFYNKAKQTSTGFDRSGIPPNHPPEVIEKIRIGNLGKKYTDKVNISKGRSGSANGMYGKTHTEESKRLMSINKMGPQDRVLCPHCFKEGGKGNMTRYHFDNCKLSPIC